MFDLTIRNGRVHTASDSYRADIGVKDGKVHTIASVICEGERVLDASGLEVLPGIVDAHTHHGPGSDPTIKTDRDFYTGTVASVYGGITTILDFAPQRKGRSLAEGIDERMRLAEDRAIIDYGFHVVVVDANQPVYDEDIYRSVENLATLRFPKPLTSFSRKGYKFSCYRITSTTHRPVDRHFLCLRWCLTVGR